MQQNDRHIFVDISHQAFQLFISDLDTLRSKFVNINVDMPKMWARQMKRRPLVDQLLKIQFGTETVNKYYQQCKEWDQAFLDGLSWSNDAEICNNTNSDNNTA